MREEYSAICLGICSLWNDVGVRGKKWWVFVKMLLLTNMTRSVSVAVFRMNTGTFPVSERKDIVAM
jgi:hypothetical protein